MRTKIAGKWKELSVQKKVVCITSVTAVCMALIVITGISVYKKHAGTAKTTGRQRTEMEIPQSEAVSGSGYVAYGTAAQEFTLTLTDGETSAPLVVEEICVSAQDTVTEGEQILKVTEESLEQAERFLAKAVKSAENALTTEKMEYTKAKMEAEYTYIAEAGLNETAKAEYESQIAALEEKVSSAQSSLEEAYLTVNDNPVSIAEKENQIASLNSQSSEAEAKLSQAQGELSSVKEVYEQEKSGYETALEELRAVAIVCRYLGSYRGEDTQELDTVLSEISKEAAELAGSSEGTQAARAFSVSAPAAGQSAASDSREAEEAGSEAGTASEIDTLLESLKGQYTTAKSTYEAHKNAYKDIKTEKEELDKVVAEYQSVLSSAEKSVSSLNQEINQLSQELEKADSQLPSLEAAYAEALNNQVTEMVSVKETYRSDMLSYEYAKNNYDLTMERLDQELEAAEEAVAAAQENADLLATQYQDGIVRAARDGKIQMIGCQEGDELSGQSSLVFYEDTSYKNISISVSQADVTSVEVGDTAMIYIEETGQLEGTVTAVAASSASQSVSSVSYTVTVSIDGEGEGIENGTSAAVYLNMEEIMGGPQENNLQNPGEQNP
ncbi:hypothetical protein C3B58_05790 [Lactonifactor longoviformis]|uniref:HlyD family secretion protein n=1 Tax=Lactonifactor longoviformis DSM 17459 TaxID=1122155 RepID=A0A1M4U192_9CLOT|nr:HlyD family efflux transporter periplasmic adaptor subunit [Lactonifactor longoviformis]POP33814.1 hypothetical protein C3B58_05790 [Lactonifactor longoviformis]SHE50376.1 HlyD family secretion protein [Lactonifactor longoviformis DSM 17459]